MKPEPSCKLALTDFTTGKRQHCPDRFGRIGVQFPTIGAEKQTNRHQRGAHVTVCERMVLRQPKGVRRRKPSNVTQSIVMKSIQRAREGGIQQPFVPHTFKTAEASETFAMQEQ